MVNYVYTDPATLDIIKFSYVMHRCHHPILLYIKGHSINWTWFLYATSWYNVTFRGHSCQIRLLVGKCSVKGLASNLHYSTEDKGLLLGVLSY